MARSVLINTFGQALSDFNLIYEFCPQYKFKALTLPAGHVESSVRTRGGTGGDDEITNGWRSGLL